MLTDVTRIRGAVPLLRDVMATLGVGFERHDDYSGQ